MRLGVQGCVAGRLKMYCSSANVLWRTPLFRHPAPCLEPQSTIFEIGSKVETSRNFRCRQKYLGSESYGLVFHLKMQSFPGVGMLGRHLFIQLNPKPGRGRRYNIAVFPTDGFFQDLSLKASPRLYAFLN